MFIIVINKMFFYFYKYYLLFMKIFVFMVYICVLKGFGQNYMYNFYYKNKIIDIYRYFEVVSILSYIVELYMYKEFVIDLFFIFFINLYC